MHLRMKEKKKKEKFAVDGEMSKRVELSCVELSWVELSWVELS